MPIEKAIVIGGSAGSLEALIEIVRSLQVDLPAAIFVVIHGPPRQKSYLPQVLAPHTRWQIVLAADQASIESGHIYVAVPDRHLLLAHDHIHLSRGPKEGLHRPSINATFRTASMAYGERVIGVLLSGMLDDGAA
ncbi:MAG TPA: chemotaxis protein CheB, partial [Chloroflexota bacterium]